MVHWIDKDFILSLGMADFRKLFAKANHIVIISGAGISAESGIPTFRGAGGYWRKWQAQVSDVSRILRGCPERSHKQSLTQNLLMAETQRAKF